MIMKERQSILRLTVSKIPFEVMYTHEKLIEFRRPSAWIMSRLYDKSGSAKKYDHVEIVNGYGKKRPRVLFSYDGFFINSVPREFKYSNGLVVKAEVGTICIRLSPVNKYKAREAVLI